MSEAASIVPFVAVIIGALFVLAFAILFFILRYHWHRYAFNPGFAGVFLTTYAVAGIVLSVIMFAGIAGLFI